MSETILVTGGTGFIGSHTCVSLLENGYKLVVLDNLSNSSRAVIKRVCTITGKNFDFHEGDILDTEFLKDIFSGYCIDAVIHFAGLKAVSESIKQPIRYYENNVTGTINLCKVMAGYDCKNLVFSSSATVYGSAQMPIDEGSELGASNPYGRSKLIVEEFLSDLVSSNNDWNITLLRYFNPIGAHPTGLIGEAPGGIPNNLVPYITQVAVGKLDKLKIFGNDYPTKDGTGVRDYIHVMDLAYGHLKALQRLSNSPGLEVYNLGTGVGYSVLEIIEKFEEVSGIKIPSEFTERRSGDVPECWADVTKAKENLGWVAERGLTQMMKDAWNWQNKNINGYN